MATAQEVFVDLKNKLKQLTATDQLLSDIAREMWIITSKRIFTDGILSDGSKLQYNSGPTLAGASSFSTKSGANFYLSSKEKRKKLKWVTLKSGARLFEVTGGFKEIKEKSGTPNPFDFTHQLKKSYFWEPRKGESVLGFIDIKRHAPDGKTTSTTNAEIAQGLEENKGIIFQLTSDEEKQVDVIIDKYLDNILNG